MLNCSRILRSRKVSKNKLSSKESGPQLNKLGWSSFTCPTMRLVSGFFVVAGGMQDLTKCVVHIDITGQQMIIDGGLTSW